jgi:NADH-quinone oxidoreductase subunit G
MLEAAVAGELKALYLIGVDPIRDFEDPRLARAALDAVDSVIVQDVLPNETTPYADVILPAMVSQERIGSFTTWEGRRQPFAATVPAQGQAQHDWDILRQLALAMGSNLGWESANDVRREAAPLMEAAGDAPERLAAIPAATEDAAPEHAHGADEFDVVVVDQLLADSTMLAGAKALLETARPAVVAINESDARRLGITTGRHVSVIGHATSVELPAKVTAGVVPGCIVLPGTSSGLHAAALAEQGGPLHVRLEAAEGSTDLSGSDPAALTADRGGAS